ncbi:MAG: hypothetical protein M3167_06185 [Acidobacteriota bacterium]|nr:hypothetical protein [Acidobacteriota bacterium]MDQ6892253.1 hypothetical protein [Acidobacteriota bacterium]
MRQLSPDPNRAKKGEPGRRDAEAAPALQVKEEALVLCENCLLPIKPEDVVETADGIPLHRECLRELAEEEES